MSFEDDPINWFVQKRVIPRRLYCLTPPCVSSEYFFVEEFLKFQKDLEKISIHAWQIMNLVSQKQPFFEKNF